MKKFIFGIVIALISLFFSIWVPLLWIVQKSLPAVHYRIHITDVGFWCTETLLVIAAAIGVKLAHSSWYKKFPQ